jgi:hypothetical protein
MASCLTSRVLCFVCVCLCRSLKVLSLEDSAVIDAGGEWLHALAQNNSVLESLNFAVVGLDSASVEDLALLVGNCKSLVSLKVSGYNTLWVPGVDHAGIATHVMLRKFQKILIAYSGKADVAILVDNGNILLWFFWIRLFILIICFLY